MNKEIALLIVLLAIVLAIVGYSWQQDRQIRLANIPPEAPNVLVGQPLSATEIKLTWRDNSNNEDGFYLYRDGSVIAAIPKNTKEYVDGGLRPATSYRYEVEAYNQAGESDIVLCSVKTLNPSIQIWLEKIGVHENGEEGEFARELWDYIQLQPLTGEVQVGFVVTDGKNTLERSIPHKGYFELEQDEVLPVNALLFASGEVGDYIRLFSTAYEQDGGFKEQVIYNVLDIATGSYMGSPASLFLTLAGVDFTKIYADIFGAEDDWLGSYVSEWTNSDNWGVGNYVDIKCKRDNGNIGLRLWFRVICPVYDYSLEETPSQ